MIDLKQLKNNPEYFKKSSRNKNYQLDNLIDEILLKYEEYLGILSKEQISREQLNLISKKISKNSSQKEIDEIRKKAKVISTEATFFSQQAKELKKVIDEKLSYIPNPPLEIVPISMSEEDNVVLSTHLDELKKNSAKPHWDILNDKKLYLKEEAIFLSGARNVIYQDKGAKLIKAIENFMLEVHTEINGYTQMETPFLVNQEVLFNTSQLPKMEEDLYKLKNGQYLIPTAEVTLTNLGANKIFKLEELPKKYVAATSCFRKEAGSAGKDTRGIIRLHQFRKVELVKIVTPENSIEELKQTMNDAISILEKLKLPYRILQLVSSDISFGSQITYDLEVWMPSTQTYREISSISLMGDFQARRMKAKFKTVKNKKEFVHTINGSGLAIDRTFAAILENYQDDKGNIIIPEVLKKYLSFDQI